MKKIVKVIVDNNIFYLIFLNLITSKLFFTFLNPCSHLIVVKKSNDVQRVLLLTNIF